MGFTLRTGFDESARVAAVAEVHGDVAEPGRSTCLLGREVREAERPSA